jgi:D-3-phosphoglycerate dehydrogenase / 2-oxoglutarate reductase
MVMRIVVMEALPFLYVWSIVVTAIPQYGKSRAFKNPQILSCGLLMPHVLIAGKIHAAGLAVLEAAKGVTLELVPEVTLEAYAPRLPEADGLLLRTQPLKADLLATAPNLKIVSRHGVGYDAVDVAALNARKIPLAIVGDVNSRAVAEHTLMLMLAAARRTVAHHLASTTGNWNERNRFDAVELDGKTLLIIGFGRIGRRVAKLAKAFGMKIVVHDPYVTVDQARALDAEHAGDLNEALATADYVSVHLPGGQDTALGAAELALMKSSAIIINAARGGLVDEAALDMALRERRIRAAALDVLTEEPPSAAHPLLDNPYVTISPHNAGLTQECAMRMGVAAAQNIIDCFDGQLNTSLVVNAKEVGLS